MATAPDSTCVLIVGMHRSGTSLVAGALNIRTRAAREFTSKPFKGGGGSWKKKGPGMGKPHVSDDIGQQASVI